MTPGLKFENSGMKLICLAFFSLGKRNVGLFQRESDGKRFESGLCRHPEKPPVAVTAGIGGTFIMNRLFCPPEMLLVSLIQRKSEFLVNKV